MTLKFCPYCGEKLVRITSKTSKYKAVCSACEITYKVVQSENQEVITLKASSGTQMSEAAIS
ncbi:MAG: hypothetical protein RR324_05045 [Cellulosilyticaceae bacterium]